MKRVYWLLMVVILWIFTGCNGEHTTTSPLQPSTSPLESPIPTEEVVLPLFVPTPQPGTGIVIGSVIIETVGKPMASVEVFLGTPIGADEETPLFGLDPSVAPSSVTDAYGRFVITDVPPGKYVVILWSPVNSIMARDVKNGTPLVISVDDQRVVDVGELVELHP